MILTSDKQVTGCFDISGKVTGVCEWRVQHIKTFSASPISLCCLRCMHRCQLEGGKWEGHIPSRLADFSV